MPNPPGGYQPDTKSESSRRADFDLLRRIAVSERGAVDIGDRLAALEAKTTPTPWTPLTLTAYWTRYDLNTPPLAYRKLGDEVQVRGYLLASTGAQSVVSTLPVGFRPAYSHEVPNNVWNNNSTYVLGLALVEANGNITVTAPTWVPPVAVPIDFRFSETP